MKHAVIYKHLRMYKYYWWIYNHYKYYDGGTKMYAVFTLTIAPCDCDVGTSGKKR